MNKNQMTRTSKFLSMVLRHQPETAFITLDAAGWVEVETLLSGCAKAGHPLTRAELEHVVAENAKKRFEFDAAGTRIRASQGHSVEVELEYPPAIPPETLYHGTIEKILPLVKAEGLRPMQRHHVHLSAAAEQAREVGARRGQPVILKVRAGEMHRADMVFRCSTNGVWLAEHVSPEFIEFP